MDVTSQEAAIRHEMVHAQQFCDVHGGINNMGQCKKAEKSAVSKLNRNRWEGFSRRKPHREFETRGTRGGGC